MKQNSDKEKGAHNLRSHAPQRKIKALVISVLIALPGLIHASHKVTLTVYHPVPAQCNARPLLTADGSRIDLRRLKAGRLRWCAVSRDLLRAYPYGSRIYVKGYGWYEVHDTTNKRLRRTVDLLLHPSDKRMIKEQTTVRK